MVPIALKFCMDRVNMAHMVKSGGIKGKYAQIRVIMPKYSQI